MKNCEKFYDPTNRNSTCHNYDRHSHKLTGWYHTGPLPMLVFTEDKNDLMLPTKAVKTKKAHTTWHVKILQLLGLTC